MLRNILKRLIKLLDNNYFFLISDDEKALLTKAKMDLDANKHINFYAVDAEKQINDMLSLTEVYIKQISDLIDRLEESPNFNSDVEDFIDRLSYVLLLLERKERKLTRLQNETPEGMLDVKRAIYLAKESSLSESSREDMKLKGYFNTLKLMLADINEQYNAVIQRGGSIESTLIDTTTLYWHKLKEYSDTLEYCFSYLNRCKNLTLTGQLAFRCIENAIQNLPTEESIHRAIRLLEKARNGELSTISVLKKIGFYSSSSREACLHLSQLGKLFFHMPHNEDRYHFDYDPREDLIGTGGNCFGESMMFIHSLSAGKFKRICPESALINFQIDQSNQLKFEKQTLGEGETLVSADSKYKSLQWEDVKHVFLDNPDFNPGDLCGLIFSMNEYTKSQTDFTPRHIAAIAKMDTKTCPYKYVVFEKELGTFGLVDDESLSYLMSHHLIPLYKGMHYSQIELVKYGEATEATYNLIRSIKPLCDGPIELKKLTPLSGTFFEPNVRPPEPPRSNYPSSSSGL